MNGSTTFDLSLTHAVLNTLTAGFKGKFTAWNMLAQLKYSAVTAEVLSQTRLACATVDKWNARFEGGEALVTREGSEAHSESRKLWGLFEALKRDLVELAQELRDVRGDAARHRSQEAAVLRVGALARFAYSREHYLQGMVRFAQRSGAPASADAWREALAGCEGEIARVHQLFQALYGEDGGAEPLADVVRELDQQSRRMPAMFLSQCHDMSQVVALARRGLTFDLTQISPRQVPEWRAIGMGPKTAGYWHAQGISPSAVKAWLDAGISDPIVAGGWHAEEFTADLARRWNDVGLDHLLAVRWRQLGFSDPAQAKAWRDAGFEYPEGARVWRDAGFNPEGARTWRASQFSASDAASWKKQGINTPLAARVRQDQLNRLSASHTAVNAAVSGAYAAVGRTALQPVEDLGIVRSTQSVFPAASPTRRYPGLRGTSCDTPQPRALDAALTTIRAQFQPANTGEYSSREEWVTTLGDLIARDELGTIPRVMREGARWFDEALPDAFAALVELVVAAGADARGRWVRALLFAMDIARQEPGIAEAHAAELEVALLSRVERELLGDLPQELQAHVTIKLCRGYLDRAAGLAPGNLKRAMRALQLVPKPAMSESKTLWAEAQHLQGRIFSRRERGERDENLARAAACQRAALGVFSPGRRPLDWAMAQVHLGDVITELAEDGAEDEALACYLAAVDVLKKHSYPYHMARAQARLGQAYFKAASGPEDKQMLLAAQRLTEALEHLPEGSAEAARARLQLGHVYAAIENQRREHNWELARAHFGAALRVFTEAAYPTEHRDATLALIALQERADAEAELEAEEALAFAFA